MANKLIVLTLFLIFFLSGCGSITTETCPACFVVVPANDDTPPTVRMSILGHSSSLNIELNEKSQPTTVQPHSDLVSVSAIAVDEDGGIKKVNLWATYTYYKPDETVGPDPAGMPLAEDISNATVGESTLKNRGVSYTFDLKQTLASWSKIQVDVWAEGENFHAGRVQTPVLSIIYPPEPILDGELYREASGQDIYYISSEKKIRIPTSDALTVMGYSASDVKIVGDGALSDYISYDIPSSSATPGSLVYPPDGKKHIPLTGIPNTTRVISQGKEIQLAELYGWLRGVDDGCGDGEDFWYFLELDTDWALAQGIDLNYIIRVGNIAEHTISVHLPGFRPRKAMALPLIKVELDTWGRSNRPPVPGGLKPVDWTFVGNCGKSWPFDHYQPDPSGPKLSPLARDISIANLGPYVRIAGSLITDDPHDVQHRPHTILSRYFAYSDSWAAEWEGSVPDWRPGEARWTEIHPPDLIEIIEKNDPRYKEHTVTTRAVALAARVGATPGPIIPSCEVAEFDIFPEAKRPENSQVAYEELRGTETYFPWGENADNGSWITPFEDHIRVKARVCGGAIGGSAGRFKAIYRVWWKVQPAGQVRRTGSFVTSDKDEIQYVIEPNAVATDIVEFQLCLDQGLTWEKRMNLPDGIGNSWDLVVKDNKRCDTNSLWAHQVLNGQKLTFYKEKGVLAGITKVYELPLSDLGNLPGGTRVTFTWVKDS